MKKSTSRAKYKGSEMKHDIKRNAELDKKEQSHIYSLQTEEFTEAM